MMTMMMTLAAAVLLAATDPAAVLLAKLVGWPSPLRLLVREGAADRV